MAPKPKKVIFGGLLLVSATIVLTWMHYSSRTPVVNISEPYELKSNMKKSEMVQTEKSKKLLQVQLELVKSLAKEEVKVTSEDSSSDYSSDSVFDEVNDDDENRDTDNKLVNNGSHKPAPPGDEEETERDRILEIEDENGENNEIDDDTSASESGFSETNKWPWVQKQNIPVNNVTEQVNIDTGNNVVRIISPAAPEAHVDTSLEKLIRKGVNYYKWDDRDPDSYKSLPLKSEEDSPAQLQDRVVFNRVGKCGSRSVILLLRHLAIVNNFHMISSEVYNSTKMDTAWQERLVHSIEQFQTPFIFQRHLHYVNFTDYGGKPPVYINIIRDPFARMVSQYYFKRFGDGKQTDKNRFSGPEEERYQTFDECVLKQKAECTGKKAFYIVPFFCGQHKYCRIPSKLALNQAIRNVEKEYLFVGILEELEDSLSVLDRLLPSMFKGALEHYLHPVGEDTNLDRSRTTTLHKKKPSPEAEKIMKEEMVIEYQFYNYVRNKFHKTREALGITPYTSRPSS
ncbi:uronyl 2-sulfotransferase-like [Amphiura filiformis]|uniref:uronyl 2-sulfotransferase-like n=1 Tax=Amphiura filiformis TaxID=82378 RepID=UPI003B211756